MGTGEIKKRSEIDEIIAGCKVCRLAAIAGGEPYIIPISFGYDGKNLYLHTGLKGRKITAFEENPRVCFEFEEGVELIEGGDDPCSWSFSFRSVIGYGEISELYGDKKRAGLNRIMEHYSGREWEFDEEMMPKTRVWMIEISEISGRSHGEK
ncbi:MAG: pyridoxamine 5'-phosphate oxidase family protein [Candidatus Latescibacteria bacterium]|nr:pyridoxamine 5'-phosphate oxidase family protein [bacterium]MBD3424718.1 pyridoxamine 5'-phosphate oxidase family protein [Candidatus Latescibacterota bacterium]